MRGTEFAALAAFVAVAECQNFARAATVLGIAPSTLSQEIRALEERLAVRLFNRTTRSVAMTPAGERLLSRVRPAFGELAQAAESLSEFRDQVSGTLRLSASSVAAHMLLVPIIGEFLALHPAITVEIALDNSDSDIVTGRFDAGLRYGRRIARDMVTLPFGPESRKIAMAAPIYLQRHPPPRSPYDLDRHDCIRYRRPDGQIPPWSFEKAGEVIEVGVSGSLIVNDPDLMVAALRRGVGIGYIFEAYVEQDLADGRLVPLLRDWSDPHQCYYLYYPSRRLIVPPLRAFIDFIGRESSGSPATAAACPSRVAPATVD